MMLVLDLSTDDWMVRFERYSWILGLINSLNFFAEYNQ